MRWYEDSLDNSFHEQARVDHVWVTVCSLGSTYVGVVFFFFRGGGHGVFFSLSVLDFVFFLSPFLRIMSSTMKKDI